MPGLPRPAAPHLTALLPGVVPVRTPWPVRRSLSGAVIAAVAARRAVTRLRVAARRVLAAGSSGEPVSGPASGPASVTAPVRVPPVPEVPLVRPRRGAVMTVVAHPDDDLLFTSPDLLDSIRSGDPVLTVCVTSGDARRGVSYARCREAGLLRAYAHAAGVPHRWETGVLAGLPQRPLVHALVADAPVGVVFLRLPDGGWSAAGDPEHEDPTLHRLLRGQVAELGVLGRRARFSAQQLVDLLAALMRDVDPAVVATLDPATAPGRADHADHRAVARATRLASREHPRPHTFTGYAGYCISHWPENVAGEDQRRKAAAVERYRSADPYLEPIDLVSAWSRRQYVVISEEHPA